MYSIILNETAKLYEALENYQEAERLYMESLQIKKDISDTNSLRYSELLNNLAVVYSKQGNYINAEPLFLKSLKITKNIIGAENIYYAASLNGLASLHECQNRYDKALPLYEESLAIVKKIFGETHPTYSILINNLSLLLAKQGKYSDALSLCKEALEIRKHTLGTEHPDYATSLNNLAVLYIIQNDYTHAEPIIRQTLAITKNFFGEESPSYITSLNNSLTFHYERGDLMKWENELFQYLRSIQNAILNQASFQSANELNAFVKANESIYFDSQFSSLLLANVIKPTINCEFFNTAILLKNLTLRNNTQVQSRIRQSKDTVLINTLEEFQSLKRQLNKYATLSKAEQPNNIKDLEERANTLEKKLVTGSQAFKEAQDFTNIKWEDVQKALKKNQAAIEFVSFRYYNKKWTDSILYAAMVIRPQYSFPKIIPLFEQKQLDSLLKRNPSLPEQSYLNNLYSKENFALYNLIVKPIDSLLQGVTSMYVSPSGSLYNLNLGQIMSNWPDGNSVNVHILGTTGELPKYSALRINPTTISNAVVFGGINYDTASNSEISFTPAAYTPGFEQVASVANRGGVTKWAYLPGTLNEASQVTKISAEAGIKVNLVKGDEANESTFKNLNGFSSPYIFHLATHGYFFPNPVKEKPKDFNWQGIESKLVYKWSEDPLLRSGLILAGANKAWQNSAFITDNTEDGILTSMEVANVDLSNCKLAVLSACETGLGDINGSEGVFGLQRGFKLAGVKNIIMTLWKIPDAQSAELLQLFYQNCFSGLSVHEALKQAQKSMSDKYPPYYWAGFVLLE